MHAIAHGGVRAPWESLHWKLTPGEKYFAVTGNRTCVSGILPKLPNAAKQRIDQSFYSKTKYPSSPLQQPEEQPTRKCCWVQYFSRSGGLAFVGEKSKTGWYYRYPSNAESFWWVLRSVRSSLPNSLNCRISVPDGNSSSETTELRAYVYFTQTSLKQM